MTAVPKYDDLLPVMKNFMQKYDIEYAYKVTAVSEDGEYLAKVLGSIDDEINKMNGVIAQLNDAIRPILEKRTRKNPLYSGTEPRPLNPLTDDQQ